MKKSLTEIDRDRSDSNNAELICLQCTMEKELKVTQLNSQGHNLYKLKNLSLEPVKIADYFKETNVFTLCLKKSKLKVKSSISKNITSSNFKGLAYTFPDDAYEVL